MQPEISLFMSSIRPYRWLYFWNRLKQTNIPFEMVIWGPKDPDFKLPPEIRFYKTDVKPAQCLHGAALYSTGKYLLQAVDDLEYAPNTIEDMYRLQELAEQNNEKVMTSAVYHQAGYCLKNEQNIAGQPGMGLALLPVCGIFPRKGFIEVGGVDRRFIGAMGELDLYQRLSNAGYKTEFVSGIVNENLEHQHKEKTSLCGKFWNVDRPRFIKLWSKHNTLESLCSTRNDVVRPYEEEDLLTINQDYEGEF